MDRYESKQSDDFMFVFISMVCIAFIAACFFLIVEITHKDDVHIIVTSNGETLLEYTGNEDSFTSSGKSYVFTVDNEKYYFENVDSVKVEKVESITQKYLEKGLIALVSAIGTTLILIVVIKLMVYLIFDRPERKENTLNEFRSALKQLQDDVNTIKKQTTQTDDKINSTCMTDIPELKLKLDEIYKLNRR